MRMKMMENKKECYMCRKLFGPYVDLPYKGLELHHMIPGTANRKKSDKYGLVVWLCPKHHRYIHSSGGAFDMKDMKAYAQLRFEHDHTREEFIKEFGKSYL